MASIRRPIAQTAPHLFLAAIRTHLQSLLLLATLQIADVISTHVALGAGLSEANPIPATILAVAGEGGMVAVRLLAIGLFLVVVWRLQGRFRTNPWRAVHLFNLITLVAVISNAARLV